MRLARPAGTVPRPSSRALRRRTVLSCVVARASPLDATQGAALAVPAPSRTIRRTEDADEQCRCALLNGIARNGPVARCLSASGAGGATSPRSRGPPAIRTEDPGRPIHIHNSEGLTQFEPTTAYLYQHSTCSFRHLPILLPISIAAPQSARLAPRQRVDIASLPAVSSAPAAPSTPRA